MKFTTKFSIDSCRQKLLSYASDTWLLPDTVIMMSSLQGKYSEFLIQRVWKAKANLFQYTVIQAKGTLSATPDNHTNIDVKIQINIVGFAIVAFIMLLLFPFLRDPRNNCIVMAGFIFILGMLIFDFYVIYNIVDELKQLRI
jgi:hypothetical protein